MEVGSHGRYPILCNIYGVDVYMDYIKGAWAPLLISQYGVISL